MTWNLMLLRRVFITAVILATLFALTGSLLAGVWWLGLAFIGLGIGWWFSHYRRLAGSDKSVFLLYLAGAAYAGFLGVAPIWLLLGGIAALIAWDLDGFLRQLTAVTLIVGEALLVKDHLQQLGSVVGLSLILGTAVLIIQINISFGMAFILAFLAIWGLGLILGQVVEK